MQRKITRFVVRTSSENMDVDSLIACYCIFYKEVTNHKSNQGYHRTNSHATIHPPVMQ